MADDIVARLREVRISDPLPEEAAAEIEWLRAEIKRGQDGMIELMNGRDRLRAALERISTMDFDAGTHEQAVETMTDIARAALAGRFE